MLCALVCTDGSPAARSALAEGLSVVAAADRLVLAMAVAPAGSAEAFGTGIGRAAGTVAQGTALESDAGVLEARRQLAAQAQALGLEHAEQTVILGSPGPAICALAESLPASVIVLSTRGLGGLRRTVLGSVSDHVVRHAPCPVVIARPAPEG